MALKYICPALCCKIAHFRADTQDKTGSQGRPCQDGSCPVRVTRVTKGTSFVCTAAAAPSLSHRR